uniref:Uncharacterized protein n=1 Tax=Ailuropoda melanoleuca TaxID=9646 RepID=A0A7N5KRV3_AILME
MTEQMTLCGTLKDHNGWLSQIPTIPQFLDMILLPSQTPVREPFCFGISQRVPPHADLKAIPRMC